MAPPGGKRGPGRPRRNLAPAEQKIKSAAAGESKLTYNHPASCQSGASSDSIRVWRPQDDTAQPAAHSAAPSTTQFIYETFHTEPTPTCQTAPTTTMAMESTDLEAGNPQQDVGKDSTASGNKFHQQLQQPHQPQEIRRARSVETIGASPSPSNVCTTANQGKLVNNPQVRLSSPHQFAKKAKLAKRPKGTPNYDLVTPNGARVSSSQLPSNGANINVNQQYGPMQQASRPVQLQGLSYLNSSGVSGLQDIEAAPRPGDARAEQHYLLKGLDRLKTHCPEDVSQKVVGPAACPRTQLMHSTEFNAPIYTATAYVSAFAEPESVLPSPFLSGLIPSVYPPLELEESQLERAANYYFAKDARERAKQQELFSQNQEGGTVNDADLSPETQDPGRLIDVLHRSQILNELLVRYLSASGPAHSRNMIETLAFSNRTKIIEWLQGNVCRVNVYNNHLIASLGSAVPPNAAPAEYTVSTPKHTAEINPNPTLQVTTVPPSRGLNRINPAAAAFVQQQQQQHQGSLRTLLPDTLRPLPQPFVEYHTAAQAKAHTEVQQTFQAQAQSRDSHLQPQARQRASNPSTYPSLDEQQYSQDEHHREDCSTGEGQSQVQQQVNAAFPHGLRQQQLVDASLSNQHPQQANPPSLQVQIHVPQANITFPNSQQQLGQAISAAGVQVQHQQNIALTDPQNPAKVRGKKSLKAGTAEAAKKSQKQPNAAAKKRKLEAEVMAEREATAAAGLVSLSTGTDKGKGKAEVKDKDEELKVYLFSDNGFWQQQPSGLATTSESAATSEPAANEQGACEGAASVDQNDDTGVQDSQAQAGAQEKALDENEGMEWEDVV